MTENSGKTNSRRRFAVFAIELASILDLTLVDLLIKDAAARQLENGETVVLIKNFIGLCYTENTGAAFSVMENSTAVLSVITAVLIAVGVIALLLGKIEGKLYNVCAVAIISGGLGNLVDRLRQGYVIDYIETLFVDFPIFNLADILITCGVFVLCGRMIYDTIKEGKERKKAAQTEDNENSDEND